MKRSSSEVLKTLGENAKRASSRLLTFVALGLAVASGSCSKGDQAFSGGRYRIPWSDSQGKAILQTVEIRTLTNPAQFSGTAARILVQPADGGGTLTADQPVGRFIRGEDGVVIPADFITMQAITAYAHQERLQELDQQAGLDRYLSWPLTLAIDVKVLDRGNLVQNNAIYDGKLNALLIVPYDQSRLPISLNGGILAHEHFHYIFQKAVLDKVRSLESANSRTNIACNHSGERSGIMSIQHDEGETGQDGGQDDVVILDESQAREEAANQIPPAIYNAFLLRALNEGLADFWGWIYSGDASFVGRSLPSEDRMRRIDFDSMRLRDDKRLRESLVDLSRPDKIIREEYRIGRAYSLGTQYARFLREIVDGLKAEEGLSDTDAKMSVARALMASLPALSTVSVESYKTSFLSPNVILKSLTLNLPKVTKQSCDRLDRFRAVETSYEKPRACVLLEGAMEPTPTPTPAPTPLPSPSPVPTATPTVSP